MEALPQCRLFGWTSALTFGGLPANPVLSSVIGMENAQESPKEEGRSAGGCERDPPPPASNMCAQEALSLPDSALTQRACQLFRSPFSLEAALKNKLQLMGVLKLSCSIMSKTVLFPQPSSFSLALLGEGRRLAPEEWLCCCL